MPPRTGSRSQASITGKVLCCASRSHMEWGLLLAVWLHTITDAGSRWSSAPSSSASALGPPAEQPMTMASMAGMIGGYRLGSAEQAQRAVQGNEITRGGRQCQALAHAEAQEAARHQAVAEHRQHVILQCVRKV